MSEYAEQDFITIKQAILTLVAVLAPEPDKEDVKKLVVKYPHPAPEAQTDETAAALQKLDHYNDGMDSYSWTQLEKANPALASTAEALRARINEWADKRDAHIRAQWREAVRKLRAKWAFDMLEMIERGRYL